MLCALPLIHDAKKLLRLAPAHALWLGWPLHRHSATAHRRCLACARCSWSLATMMITSNQHLFWYVQQGHQKHKKRSLRADVLCDKIILDVLCELPNASFESQVPTPCAQTQGKCDYGSDGNKKGPDREPSCKKCEAKFSVVTPSLAWTRSNIEVNHWVHSASMMYYIIF